MRKWKNLSAPDDPEAWTDVSGMVPTKRGTYAVADFYDSGTNKTATGETLSPGSGISAWCFNTLSGQRCYVVGKKIWEYSGGSLTDRTGALAAPSEAFMCQYGDITILARGTGAALASSSGGNFAALAGAPSARIVVVQSNAVVALNTSTSSDGWSASDVGDYTNWSTGEAASGRILEGNGPITAAVAFGTDIIVFKADSIFRMTYVGGQVKWQIQKLVVGIGCVNLLAATNVAAPAVTCGTAIFFLGQAPSGGLLAEQYYVFDGVSQPRLANPETQLWPATISHIGYAFLGMPMYDHQTRTVSVVRRDLQYIQPCLYNLDSDAWGQTIPHTSPDPLQAQIYVRGDQSAVNAVFSTNSYLRPFFQAGTDKFILWSPLSPGGSTSCSGYVQTAKMGGDPDQMTTFKRIIPLLRRRRNNSAGSPAASLTFKLYNERHRQYNTSGVLFDGDYTQSVAESSIRNRFDLLSGAATGNYAEFIITFTDMDAEIEDVLVRSTNSGSV